MTPSRELLENAEQVLSRALADYQSPGLSEDACNFYELRMQAAIFNYEIIRQVVSLWLLEPKEFAMCVTLKEIVHKLYEYDKALTKNIVNRLVALAKKRNLNAESERIKQERKVWRIELNRLQRWSDLRNETTGHYGKNIANQVALISQLTRDEVIEVTEAFLRFNLVVNKSLARIGLGK